MDQVPDEAAYAEDDVVPDEPAVTAQPGVERRAVPHYEPNGDEVFE